MDLSKTRLFTLIKISMKTIAIINGPNLDRLGEREPSIYGDQTLKDLEKRINTKLTICN